jgi:hypothetical protein
VVSGSPGNRTLGMSDLRYGTPLLFLLNDIRHFCWNWSTASFSYACCSGDRSSMVTSITSPISGILIQPDVSQQVCQKVRWRKIHTLRQAHSKPNKAGLTHEQIPELASQFSWKLTKDKAVKYQSLELAGWYQTVPYLRLESHVRWHIATRSYLSTGWKSFGSFRT